MHFPPKNIILKNRYLLTGLNEKKHNVKEEEHNMKSGLYIVATPIGNLHDISSRAVEVLKTVQVIACEDTRIAKKLLSLLGISLNKTFLTLHDHNEEEHAVRLIELIKENDISAALISDAGSPLISDPGYKLIRRCRRENVYVTVLPGCCALICALQLSGLPTNRFLFAGFLPNRDKARKEAFEQVKNINATVVFYETASRIVKSLEAAAEIFGCREMAVAREITKMYEECLNGTAGELLAAFAEKQPKGEMVLMIAPAGEEDSLSLDIDVLLREELNQHNLKTAVKNLVERYHLNKNELYARALKIKDHEQ